MEFHISRAIRDKVEVDDLLFSYAGNIIFGNVAASRMLAKQLNDAGKREAKPAGPIHAGALFAMGLIDELSHALVAHYRREIDPTVLSDAMRWFAAQSGRAGVEQLLLAFTEQFPNVAVYRSELSATEWLHRTTDGMPNREAALEELLLLWLSNINPAFTPFRALFADTDLKRQTIYESVTTAFPDYFITRPPIAPSVGSLLDALLAPILASPNSISGQLDFIREHWSQHLGQELRRTLLAIDILREEDLAIWMLYHPPTPGRHRIGTPGTDVRGFVGDEFVGFHQDSITGHRGIRDRHYAHGYQAPLHEYEAFSADQAWMSNVVLIAKSTYVWLEQLSKKYRRHIHRLDHIPQEELQLLANNGVTGLWLIGLWERSSASRTIKRLCGQGDAVASAYSLKDYEISEDLGGNTGYKTLQDRAAAVGIRLASDMVPNHMGIDSDWVIEHPDWFLSRRENPFPAYRFDGPDLSTDRQVEIKIEDHYYDQTDAAVVFRLKHRDERGTRYVYHGNDGTAFAWNDTAQLDYSKAAVREQVIKTILNMARLFPIIRFDAAMVLAKRHVQRLWFPLPGAGGSIPSRAEDAISQEEFDALMPHEFWREVVDRVAAEVPGTLLLAEAFWLLEGYFVRTLGMHRVYNSAFMNMLRDEENAKYRSYLKKTIEFDPDILKRYVNFMSNPDERTAIDQFGSGDKYFGVCTLLATLPGLPMFGHGQIEGFTERYGMEFKRAHLQESPNEGMITRHQHEIAPLLKSRRLFAESTHFMLYDFYTDHGNIDENVFAYSNRMEDQRAVIIYNNSYGSTSGTILISAAGIDKRSGRLLQQRLSEGLALSIEDSVIVAYRNPELGLEYLHRTMNLHHHGLYLTLRGYQHVVLLDWRELRASPDQPWDQLCDFLNGAGVHNLEEALWKLRLRPLHQAFCQAICVSNMQKFLEIAGETTDSLGQQMREETRPPVPASKEAEANEEAGLPEQASLRDTPMQAASKMQPLDPRLQAFVEEIQRFLEGMADALPDQCEKAMDRFAASEAPAAGETTASIGPAHIVETPPAGESGQAYRKICEEVATVAVRLFSLKQSFSVALPATVRHVLPGSELDDRLERICLPILAWLVLRSLPWQADSAVLFDRLHMRSALAETFSRAGMEDENAWRAAALVRVLLSQSDPLSAATTACSETFWADPDIRWLAGVNEASGIAYLNQERFEELLSWLQLPAWIEITHQDSGKLAALSTLEAAVVTACKAAQDIGYSLEAYIGSWSAEGCENKAASASC